MPTVFSYALASAFPTLFETEMSPLRATLSISRDVIALVMSRSQICGKRSTPVSRIRLPLLTVAWLSPWTKQMAPAESTGYPDFQNKQYHNQKRYQPRPKTFRCMKFFGVCFRIKKSQTITRVIVRFIFGWNLSVHSKVSPVTKRQNCSVFLHQFIAER